MIKKHINCYLKKKIFMKPLFLSLFLSILFFPLVLLNIFSIRKKVIKYHSGSYYFGVYSRDIGAILIDCGLHYRYAKEKGRGLNSCIKSLCDTIEHESLHFTIHEELKDNKLRRGEETVILKLIYGI